MNQSENLLQAVVENARMGADACDQLLSRVSDMELRRELMLQRDRYADCSRRAELRLCSMGVEPRPKGMPARMGMWMGMQINTITDRSPSHIADMVIQGATMGVLEITKARNSFTDADPEAQGIAASFLAMQQEAIERCKKYLVADKVRGRA